MVKISNKIGIFYNKQFNTLMISIKNAEKVTKTENKTNYSIIWSGEEIVALNIFNATKFENFSYLNQELITEINNIVSEDIFFEYTPQFVIGKIISCEDIPETHLHLCKVSIKSKELQIVCGAKNAKEGLNVVVATLGSWIPNGLQIIPGKLRGYESFGMLCSGRELNLKDQKFLNEGIIELDKSYDERIGQDFFGEL